MQITIIIKIVWLIKGYDNYGFGADNYCYNLKRCKKVKQVYNNGIIGYKLSGKFVSLKTLRELLFKPKLNNLPF